MLLSYESMTERQRELYDRVKNASRFLDLEKTSKIGNAEVHAIAAALKETKLTELYLGWNQIGDVGAKVLAEALQENRTLTVLGLYHNEIGDAGAHAIVEAVKAHSTLSEIYLHANLISDVGARAIAETLKEKTTLNLLDLRENYIGSAAAQLLREVLEAKLHIDNQQNPLALSLFPRSSPVEDVQTVFRLLLRGSELQDQSASLPALPAAIAEHILSDAHYWPSVHHIKRNNFYDVSLGGHVLQVALPQQSIQVKSILVLREWKKPRPTNTADSAAFDVIVRDEQGAVQYECAVKATFVDSTIDFVTIWPASHPIIGQMREGWQVQVGRRMSDIKRLEHRIIESNIGQHMQFARLSVQYI
ncbi:hypothetical protein CAOG_08585 [Capsaspora owczarzaki ATCC 30864]|uniref:Uncharacterized protein n=1 Tax=Capsaspora owczarzaki (strain ATCC 30864) TaxID=595528 RepID=A0A0D2WLS7_CAPO3|nr:hypothetical protein CAOG_08585 [Capsaspora owczarzaki ATCC 30864]KJE90938.1 hypothetical protein CAOG_008585 [Capsaspora owczarzaki ATCC 30864]|eukprot:XP_011270185.1 hypothetical protein CAOG_08585 [Capsaspora owczarzaki ATCC 30864]